ncbi:rod-determining factor RdfA [Natronosalvus halobius]|uniref:rod-determining factor RdfA n=1 Tax=Natronosalvus halobius TaxID=2953746 RepID=UPI0020A003EF|nr:rod-determining factor RdfA [Natronosalvus halobius]USZ73616.1 hypothetical protein NGM15_17005 [Natronosalvus halobius]
MSGENGDTDRTTPDERSTTPRDNKVARLIETYQLGPTYGEKLADLWTADGDRRESLRTLADRFNKRLLEAAMTAAGMSTVDGEITNFYRLLTADNVSSGNQTEARQRLEQAGVDVDELERDFVSYQAIRSYLKEYREVEYARDTDTTRVETVTETLQRLKTRTTSVTESSLEQLRNTNQITLGEFRLFITINVLCEDCQTQYGVIELLRNGGCNCPDDGSNQG